MAQSDVVRRALAASLPLGSSDFPWVVRTCIFWRVAQAGAVATCCALLCSLGLQVAWVAVLSRSKELKLLPGGSPAPLLDLVSNMRAGAAERRHAGGGRRPGDGRRVRRQPGAAGGRAANAGRPHSRRVCGAAHAARGCLPGAWLRTHSSSRSGDSPSKFVSSWCCCGLV